MNYIGSKFKLLSFIDETIRNIVGEELLESVFCDIFAGTGAVGRYFKTKTKRIIANDCEFYSYVLNRNYIGNHREMNERFSLLQTLNALPPRIDGFIFQNYCLGGNGERQYFSDQNGQKMDAVRMQIEEWRIQDEIDEDMYYFLLCSLLESSDKVANTASVYGAYLKHLKKTAQKDLVLEPAEFEINKTNHFVYNEDANALIKKISGDILYLDPPYNSRQYGANYHLLNTIAKYNTFVPRGKTGMRNYARSKYCSGGTVTVEFDSLIRDAQFKYIFLSYNNEGLMTSETIRRIMEKYGKYDVVQRKYQRFKADKSENRRHKADSTVEYIHILEKS